LWPGSKGLARKKHRPINFGLRISDFGFIGFLFQSAFRNRHSAIWMPAQSRTRKVPHGFFAQGPCFRAGQCLKFNWLTPTWRKVKVCKAFSFDSPVFAFYNQLALEKMQGRFTFGPSSGRGLNRPYGQENP